MLMASVEQKFEQSTACLCSTMSGPSAARPSGTMTIARGHNHVWWLVLVVSCAIGCNT